MSFKKIYFFMDPESKNTKTLPENKINQELLEKYNEQGFNIYQTVNTFIGNKRQDKDLAEIKSCFIDIDYSEILNLTAEERSVFLKDKFIYIQSILSNIKKTYKIEPSIINITYKGFHILFDYEESCYFIDEEIHKEINNKLNELLGGDENARDLSRVYKVPGFKDWKNNRKGRIKNILNNKTSGKITREIIENIFLLPFEQRNEKKVKNKKESKELKNEVFHVNLNKIKNIDALDLIQNAKDVFLLEKNILNLKIKKEGYSNLENLIIIDTILNKLKYSENYKLLEKDGKTETSGLRIEKNQEGLWEINDYSRKNRRGNYNFLKNWIFEDLEKNEYFNFHKFLYKITGFSANLNPLKKSEIDLKIFSDQINKRFDEKQIEKPNSNSENILNHFLKEPDPEEISLEFQNPTITLSSTEKSTFISNQLSEVKKDEVKYKKLKLKSSLVMIGLLNYIKTNCSKEILESKNFNNELKKEIGYKIEWKDFLNYFGETDSKKLGAKKLEYAIVLKYCSLLQYSIPVKIKIGETFSNYIKESNLFNLRFSELKEFHRGVKDYFIIYPIADEDFKFGKLGYFDKNIITFKCKDELKEFALKVSWVFNNTKSPSFLTTIGELKETFNLNAKEERTNIRAITQHLSNLISLNIIKNFEIDKTNGKIILKK